jgi:hypothetical protein
MSTSDLVAGGCNIHAAEAECKTLNKCSVCCAACSLWNTQNAAVRLRQASRQAGRPLVVRWLLPLFRSAHLSLQATDGTSKRLADLLFPDPDPRPALSQAPVSLSRQQQGS